MRDKRQIILKTKIMHNIIATGSKGNCEIYFNTIAIDMGIPFSKIEPYLHDIQLVMLSHLHQDHFNLATIERLSFERPGLRFACGKWMVDLLPKNMKNLDVLELNKWYDYGSFKVSIGKLYHDVPNAFFRLDKDGYKIFRATDTAHLEGITAKDYDLYAIEHNYDEETIDSIIANSEAKGEFSYKKGAVNTHLSIQQAREFYLDNKKESSQIIRLHESENQ